MAWLTVIFVVATGLRFLALGHQSMWYDEAVSVRLARASLSDLVFGRVKDLGNPPLYLILLHFWQWLFGSSDAGARALSAVVSAASIPVLYQVARRLTNARVALVTVVLFALAPVQIYFAQEARTFALVELLAIGSMSCLLTATDSPRRWLAWTGYAALTFLSLYAHYFTAFVVMAQVGWVLLYRRERSILLAFVAALAAAAAAYAVVWVPSLVAQLTSKGNLGRSADSWYLHMLSTPLVFGMGTTLAWKALASPLRLVGAGLAFLALVGLSAQGAWLMRRSQRPLALLIGWLAGPILLPLLVSLLLFPLYTVRYALLASPAYYILIAAGVVGGKRLARSLSAILAVTALVSLVTYFSLQVKPGWRDCAAWVTAGLQKGDVVAFDADIGETSFAHYAGPDTTRLRLLKAPDASSEYWGTSSRKEPPHSFDSVLAAAPRVWFVYSDPQAGSGKYYRDLFARNWRAIDKRNFLGIEVTLLQHPQ